MDKEVKKEGEEVKPETTVVQPEEKKPEEPTVDWKAEHEKLKTQLGQAEHTIIDLKKKKKEGEGAQEIDVEQLKEEMKAEAERLAEEKLESYKAEQARDTVMDVLSSLVTDPDKRKVVELIYEKQIQKSGLTRSQIIADINAAISIAERPILEKKLEEIKTSKISQTTISNGNPTGQEAPNQTTELSAEEEATVKAMAQRRGLSEDEVRKIFIKNKLQTKLS